MGQQTTVRAKACVCPDPWSTAPPRFVMMVWVGGKDTDSVVAALSAPIQQLTWDRGLEVTAYKRFTIATDVALYCCNPKSPWQRGTSENTNRLLMQYLTK